jgi:hypothetical protein
VSADIVAGAVPVEPATVESAPVGPAPSPAEVVFELRRRYLYNGRQVALDSIDLRIEARGARRPARGNGSGRSPLSSSSMGSSGRPPARCGRSARTWPRSPTGRRSASTAGSGSSSGPRHPALQRDRARRRRLRPAQARPVPTGAATCDEALGRWTCHADRAPFSSPVARRSGPRSPRSCRSRPDVLLLDEPTASLDPTKWVLVHLIRQLGEVARPSSPPPTSSTSSRSSPTGSSSSARIGASRSILGVGTPPPGRSSHEHFHGHGTTRHSHDHDPEHHEAVEAAAGPGPQ